MDDLSDRVDDLLADFTAPDEVPFLHRVNVLADLCTNHRGDRTQYLALVQGVLDAKAIPKIQLYSPQTFDRTWPLPLRYIPSVFRPDDVTWAMSHTPIPLALKVASVESTCDDLIRECVGTKMPLIISTGGMNEDELLHLLDLTKDAPGGVCLMHCVSLYPTPVEHMNMFRIAELAACMEDLYMDACVGWSCHTPAGRPLRHGLAAALAMDANVFEVHVRPNGVTDPQSPDEHSSVTVSELAAHIGYLHGSLIPMLGSGAIEGADRENVLRYRGRWKGPRQ